MNKKSLFYGLIFLLLAFLGQEAVAMKWTKHQWANGFRLGMKALNYAGVLGYSIYLDKEQLDMTKLMAKKAVKLNPESTNYVLSSIRSAYPELQNVPIEVVRIPGLSFCVMQYNNTHYLVVPHTDEDLKQAIHYKKTGTQKYLNQPLTNIFGRTTAQHISMLENQGHAMTPTTLDFWEGTLLHEASHILHNDYRNKMLLSFVAPLAAIYGAEKLKRTVNLPAVLSNRLTLQNIAKGLGYIPSLPAKLLASTLLCLPYAYWSEYRADQDEIKRARELSIFKAEINYLQQVPEEKSLTLATKINNFLDPHLASRTRAKYFVEAAQKLEEKQTQELTQNGINHD